jgi:hypothetical protein
MDHPMSVFKTTTEAEYFLGRPWEMLGEDPDIGPKLGALNKVLGADYQNPGGGVRVHCKDGTVRVERGTAGQPGDIILSMDADVGHRFWQGAVNIPMALSKQQVKVEGKMSDVMSILPFLGPGFEMYKGFLHAEGRDDLIGA